MINHIVDIKSKLGDKTIPLMLFEKMSSLCITMGVSPAELLVEFYSEDVETMVWLAFAQTEWSDMTALEVKCFERLFRNYEKHNESVLNVFENPLVVGIIRKYQV